MILLELENCCMRRQKSGADVEQCYCIILEIKELCSIKKKRDKFNVEWYIEFII